MKIFYLVLISWVLIFCNKNSNTGDNNIDQRNAKSKIIVVLGSSTAAGTGADPIDSSWVNQLSRQLSNDNRNTEVKNLAMGGYNTSKVVPSSNKTADTSRNVTKALSYLPDMILINLPSNDFADGFTDDQILYNYSLITNEIINAHIQYLITSTQPRNFSSIDMRKRLMFFNDKMESVYSGHLLNYYGQLATPDYLISPLYSYGDGIHLNNKGHSIIFKNIILNSNFRKVFY